MVTPIKKVVEAIWYKCDICKKEYSRNIEAENCERRCFQKACTHSESTMDYEVEERDLKIFRKCARCNLEFEHRNPTCEELDTIMRAKILVEVKC